MDLFYIDNSNNYTKTWQNVIEDLTKVSSYNPYCKHDNFYDIFLHILSSMLLGKEIILLDSDFSDNELNQLIGKLNVSDETTKLSSPLVKDSIEKQELIQKILQTTIDWKITLFTSGTTGLPKKVTHSFQTITRFVRRTAKNTSSIWGYAFNPTHMAGVQVFFQAILNGNTLVRLFGLPNNIIHEAIGKEQITHISATPTFYKLLLPCDSIFPSVKRLTSGGEKFSQSTVDQLKNVFPNAKITNVYASTEAGTLLASKDDVFSIKEGFESLLKIENNELFIHESLMGYSENLTNEWYPTGDVVDIVTENPISFTFVSRKRELISVGGYKVNPNEVEEAILKINDVQLVKVYAKSNSVLGNIIVAEVVSSNETLKEATIREALQKNLQEFKIPRIIKFVKQIETTRTGKAKRN